MEPQTTSTDILDNLIYLAIVLFILSVIVEKITQLIRYYPKQFRIICVGLIIIFYFLALRSFITGDTSQDISSTDLVVLLLVNTSFLVVFLINSNKVKSLNNRLGKFASKNALFQNIAKGEVSDPDAKEGEITFLSFILGFIVAYIFNAHLIELFINPNSKLGWNGVQPFIFDSKGINTYRFNNDFFGFDLNSALGFALTGFFLSFGSKFFHDLLDTLFQVKELKRKLNDPSTYHAENIKDFDDFLQFTQSDIIKKAIEENKAQLSTLPNFVSLHLAHDVGGSVACLNISDSNVANIPKTLQYTLPSGMKKEIPLKVIPSVSPARIQIGKVFNPNTPTQVGSIGCCFKENTGNIWLLTCAHVLNGGDFKPSIMQGPIQPSLVKYSYNGNNYNGSWEYAYQDSQFDVALYKPQNPTQIPALGLLPQPLLVSAITARQLLRFQGGVSSGHGCVFATDAEEPITFGNGTFNIKGLIKVTSQEGLSCISQQGDSGAVLYSESNEAVGLIVAANNYFTFAIPIEKIMDGWDATII